MEHEERVCPKCGETMRVMPDTEWSLFELHSIDYMCPNCLHTERHKYVVAIERRGR